MSMFDDPFSDVKSLDTKVKIISSANSEDEVEKATVSRCSRCSTYSSRTLVVIGLALFIFGSIECLGQIHSSNSFMKIKFEYTLEPTPQASGEVVLTNAGVRVARGGVTLAIGAIALLFSIFIARN